MQFKVSAKRADTGKFWGFGKIEKNNFGNLRLSFKKTPEFMEFINGATEWVNFSLFEDKPKDSAPPPVNHDSEDLPF